MRALFSLLTLLGVAAICGAAAGQGAPPAGTRASGTAADETAIRDGAAAFARAFNAADARAVAALWTPTGEYVDEAGNTFSGRPAIEKEYAALFKEHPGATIRVTIDALRFAGPDLAIEEGTARVQEPPVGAVSMARYMAIHRKQDGKWLMASVRDLESAPLTRYQALRELEALVGDWEARTGDVSVETHCEWMENRNFIRRTFKRTQGGEVATSGMQIIGVDPTTDEVVSWEFDADGGFGRALWTRDGARWIIANEAVTGAGKTALSINLLTFVNKDTFHFQSTNRTLDGAPMQDIPETKITRRK
jgi:uncharacterized protein (TIGR02246 family)